LSKLFKRISTIYKKLAHKTTGSLTDPTRKKAITHKQRLRDKVYGRRIARPLRVKRQNALDKGLETYQITPKQIKAHDFNQETWLEIGFGYGEHLIWQAENNPSVEIIGCEPFLNGVSVCMLGLIEKDIKNAHIWPDDARKVLNQLPENSISRLFVLHPDPWHKKRHHKRRFIQKEMLDQFSKIMKNGGILRMASDHHGVAEWMRDKALEHPNFEQCPNNAKDWSMRPNDWPQTRYEQKGLDAGREPRFIEFTCIKK